MKSNPKRTALIISAMDEEIEPLRKWGHAHEHKVNDLLTAYEGEAAGLRLILAKVGVGKALAALNTQRLIDLFSPDFILFTGVAGAVNPSYEIGDLVLGVDCVQHDLDASAIGFSLGTIPYTNYRFFLADEQLLQMASEFKPMLGSIHKGRILTGDQFVEAAGMDRIQERKKIIGGDCLEMEGAAVALCAVINQIPHLIVRTISDRADHSAEVDYSTFLPRAGAQNVEFVEWFLLRLSPS